MASCPLCQSSESVHFARVEDIEYFTKPGTFDFYRCGHCDVLYLDPMPFDRLDEIYPANYYSFVAKSNSIIHRIKDLLDVRYLRKVLSAVPGDKLRVLDVGGGDGWLLDAARRADARVSETLVVDIDSGARSRAEARGHRYFEGRFEDFPVGEQWDVVLMLNLIEHVSNPRAVLEKAREVYIQNGCIVIKTPNFDALDARLFRTRSWAGFHTPRHFVLFKRSSFERLARQAGLQVGGFSYTQGAPFWSISMLDVFRRAGLVSVSAERPAIYHPFTPLLQTGFAAFDILRGPFAKLSQMQFVLKR